jgi:hypothetical protein
MKKIHTHYGIEELNEKKNFNTHYGIEEFKWKEKIP